MNENCWGGSGNLLFNKKKIKKIGPSGVKLRACKRRHSKMKFTASYGLSGSNGLSLKFSTFQFYLIILFSKLFVFSCHLFQ